MKKTQSIIYKTIKKETNLLLYLFYCFVDIIFAIVKFASIALFPFVISIIVFIITLVFKIDISFDASLSWGLFSASSTVFGIAASILISVYFSNRKYYKKNSLSLFSSYKFLGIVDLLTIIILSIINLLIALGSTILQSKYSNIYSLSALVYTTIIILIFVYLVSKNSKKKFVRYLKNAGVLKKRRRSIKMDHGFDFQFTHQNLLNVCVNSWALRDSSTLISDDLISKYFKDPYARKDTNIYPNIELVGIYLEECSKYINTDFDILRLKNLIESLNDSLIDFLISEKEHEILNSIYDSLIIFSLNLHLSDYYKHYILNRLKMNQDDFPNEKIYFKYLAIMNCRLETFSSLLKTIFLCLSKSQQLESGNNSVVDEMKAKYEPIYEWINKHKVENEN